MEASTGPLATTHPLKESQFLQRPLELHQEVDKHCTLKTLLP